MYDLVGNISQISNALANEKQTFRYDSLDRLRCSGLTAINGTSGCETYNPTTDTFGTLRASDTQYVYNATTGNLQTKGSLSLTYDANHPHAVAMAGSNNYSYDGNGNMTGRDLTNGDYTLGYDQENRLVSVSATNIVSSSTPTATPTNTPTNTPTPTPTSSGSDLIFADGFESGNFSAWSANSNNAGNLSVSTTAALAGSYGLKVNFINTTTMLVRDDTPNAEPRYRARFYFNPNSITMATGDNITLMQGLNAAGTIILSVQLNRSSTSYQLRARSYDSGLANWVSTSYTNISDATHVVEVDWGNDGHLTFWIDGVQQANLTGVNNSIYTMDTLRLGAPTMTITGTSGSYTSMPSSRGAPATLDRLP